MPEHNQPANTHKYLRDTHTHTMNTHALVHMGHGEVAVTVIGSCCWGQTHNSQLSVIILHSSLFAVWKPLHVSVCVFVRVCVVDGEIGKLLVIYFSMLKRREGRGGGGWGGGGPAEKSRVNIKRGKKGGLIIIFDSHEGVETKGSCRPPLSCMLMTDVWWPGHAWCCRRASV